MGTFNFGSSSRTRTGTIILLYSKLELKRNLSSTELILELEVVIILQFSSIKIHIRVVPIGHFLG